MQIRALMPLKTRPRTWPETQLLLLTKLRMWPPTLLSKQTQAGSLPSRTTSASQSRMLVQMCQLMPPVTLTHLKTRLQLSLSTRLRRMSLGQCLSLKFRSLSSKRSLSTSHRLKKPSKLLNRLRSRSRRKKYYSPQLARPNRSKNW